MDWYIAAVFFSVKHHPQTITIVSSSEAAIFVYCELTFGPKRFCEISRLTSGLSGFENCPIILKSCHVNQALGNTVDLCHSYIFLFMIQIRLQSQRERQAQEGKRKPQLLREEPPCIHIDLTKPSGTVFIKAKKTEREEDGSTQRDGGRVGDLSREASRAQA